MALALGYTPLQLSIREQKTWILSMLFVVGNVVFPQVCHIIPQGGLILLPIYFFTLIAAYKFGWTAGLLTAIGSPLVNHLLFGMPPTAVLPILLIKSILLASTAALVASKSKSLSILLILLVVVVYQTLGGLAEGIIDRDFTSGMQDFKLGYPGLLLQVFGGWLVLKLLSNYGR